MDERLLPTMYQDSWLLEDDNTSGPCCTMAALWEHQVWTAVNFVSCISAKSIGANRPWMALNMSHRLQHNSRCQPTNQQDGVAQRQPKRDQGWIPSSEAPCMCAVCRHGTYCQTIKRRPSEPFEQEACPSPRPGRCHGCNAKTVSMLCRVTTQNVLRSHVFCLVTD
jgi:hypothetical protein